MDRLYNIITEFCKGKGLALDLDEKANYKDLSEQFFYLVNARFAQLSCSLDWDKPQPEGFEFFACCKDFANSANEVYYSYLKEYIPRIFEESFEITKKSMYGPKNCVDGLIEKHLGKHPYLNHVVDVLSYWVSKAVFPYNGLPKPLPFDKKVENACEEVACMVNDYNEIFESQKTKKTILYGVILELISKEQMALLNLIEKNRVKI